MYNAARALRFATVLETVASTQSPDVAHDMLVDLLADAMHWADANGDDFHIALAQACRHYIHELNDEQHDEHPL